MTVWPRFLPTCAGQVVLRVARPPVVLRVARPARRVQYAYLRPLPVARQYDVAYPYGVGGDSLLDGLSVNFDSWVTSAIIGYFFNRFVAGPFGVPSVTDLLGQVSRGHRLFSEFLLILTCRPSPQSLGARLGKEGRLGREDKLGRIS